MDSTRIENRIGIRASAERIWDLVGDFDAWQHWNPYEQGVEGTLRQGAPVRFTEAYPDLPSRPVQAVVADWVPMGKLVLSNKHSFLFNSSRFIILDQVEKNATLVTMGIMFSGLRGEMFHDKHRAKLRQAMEVLGERLKAAIEA